MLNIQFMTEEQSFINKRGDKVYIPDYKSLKANACCEEERAAIDECKELFERTGHDGFAFAIVYTTYTKCLVYDKETKKQSWIKKWTIYQHPWYQRYDETKGTYVRDSKENMIKEISLQEAREMKFIDN